ncbi:MAG: hypothetical protein ACXVCO_12535 [Ktedonobacterales bacterium]
MSIARFKYAYAAAFDAYQAAWANYDTFEAKRLEVEAEMARRQQKLMAGTVHLSESDKHFVNSFLNNLEGSVRPGLDVAKRFVEILETLETDVAVDIAKRAVAQCPLLVTVPLFGKWASGKLRPVTSKVTA